MFVGWNWQTPQNCLKSTRKCVSLLNIELLSCWLNSSLHFQNSKHSNMVWEIKRAALSSQTECICFFKQLKQLFNVYFCKHFYLLWWLSCFHWIYYINVTWEWSWKSTCYYIAAKYAEVKQINNVGIIIRGNGENN